jgi:hypothetical protein
MKIKREWAMPNKLTFDIPPIKQLLAEEMYTSSEKELWADPFANSSTLATFTNDINPACTAQYCVDALTFLQQFEDNSLYGVLLDAPYSSRQVSECYHHFGYEVTKETTQSSFWGNLYIEAARIIKPGGKAISFGWNSGGIGKKRGFEIARILLVCHGGHHNDTIVTVERKVGAK